MAGLVDQFARFANLFGDALLLVTSRGEVVAVNAGAGQRLFGGTPPEPGQALADFVVEPAEKVIEYLRLCARSKQRLPATLAFRNGASASAYHCEGSGSGMRDDQGAALILLRVIPKKDSVHRFAALNRQIEQLKREISRRLHAERAAADQQELLRVTLASIGDAVIATDTRGCVTFMNPVAEQLTGWPRNEALALPLERVFVIRQEHTGAPVESPVEKVLRAGTVVGLANHTLLMRKDGTAIPIDDSGAPIMDSSGNLLGVVLVFHEISERRRLEREMQQQAHALREADRRKDEFLAMLAHELRNPLAPLRNAVQILRIEGASADLARLGGVLERQTAQLTRLVDDLLDIARITRGAIQLEKRPVTLKQVLEHAIETVRPRLDERRHRLNVVLPPDTLIVDGDLARLSQVFCNLLNNAANFMEPGGEITLAAFEEGDGAVTIVRDQGRGMDSEFVARVFDLFTQEDRSLDRRQGGLGVGLTLVKSLVSMHSGEVFASSEGSGRGSEFKVYLPAASAQDGRSAQADSELGQPSFHSEVLIVDDNVDAAESLAMLLEYCGCRTRVVHDGEAAIASVQGDCPDVVLLDIGLPGMDGYKVARRLRRLPGMDRVRIVAVTGYGGELDRRRSEQAGFDGHLTKPVGLETLKRLLGDGD